jgi:hypothetical protein
MGRPLLQYPPRIKTGVALTVIFFLAIDKISTTYSRIRNTKVMKTTLPGLMLWIAEPSLIPRLRSGLARDC